MTEYVCSTCDLEIERIPGDWHEISVDGLTTIYRTPSGMVHCLRSANLGAPKEPTGSGERKDVSIKLSE
jgi:hypothetical protein